VDEEERTLGAWLIEPHLRVGSRDTEQAREEEVDGAATDLLLAGSRFLREAFDQL